MSRESLQGPARGAGGTGGPWGTVGACTTRVATCVSRLAVLYTFLSYMLVRVGLVGFLGVVVWLFQAAQSGYCLQCGSDFSETCVKTAQGPTRDASEREFKSRHVLKRNHLHLCPVHMR
jgi:nitrate reductase NapE component